MSLFKHLERLFRAAPSAGGIARAGRLEVTQIYNAQAAVFGAPDSAAACGFWLDRTDLATAEPVLSLFKHLERLFRAVPSAGGVARAGRSEVTQIYNAQAAVFGAPDSAAACGFWLDRTGLAIAEPVLSLFKHLERLFQVEPSDGEVARAGRFEAAQIYNAQAAVSGAMGRRAGLPTGPPASIRGLRLWLVRTGPAISEPILSLFKHL